MSQRSDPIGVFDSGVGGLSTLRVLAQQLPNEDFVFFGDSANAPYGNKSQVEVQRLAERVVQQLQAVHVKTIVIACNTATSAAKPQLMAANPELDLLGIEPALKAAVDAGHKRILVLGTALTLSLPKLKAQVARFQGQATIYPQACPGLAELIEHQADAEQVQALLHQLLQPYANQTIDAVVLGCTHYPFVADEIQAELAQLPTVYTGDAGVAANLQRHLQRRQLLNVTPHVQQIQLMSSRKTPAELALYRQLLGLEG